MKAYAARLAFKKCILARISLAQAEVDALEKQRDFIQSLEDDTHHDLSEVDDDLASVKEVMDERGLADDIAYQHAVYADELVALTIAGVQLNQMVPDVPFSFEGSPLHSSLPASESSSNAEDSSAEYDT